MEGKVNLPGVGAKDEGIEIDLLVKLYATQKFEHVTVKVSLVGAGAGKDLEGIEFNPVPANPYLKKASLEACKMLSTRVRIGCSGAGEFGTNFTNFVERVFVKEAQTFEQFLDRHLRIEVTSHGLDVSDPAAYKDAAGKVWDNGITRPLAAWNPSRDFYTRTPDHKFTYDFDSSTFNAPPTPQPQKPALPPQEIKSQEEVFLTGLHLEQYRHATFSPEDYYMEGLRRDAGDSRCNNALGRILMNKK